MEYRYKPQGVCSREMIFEIEGDIVKSVKILGGCAGNTLGLSNLIEGMKIKDVIEKLKGIPCGFKPTSCPDQLAKALEEYLN
ncbi:MAG: TIGR03905 family TSCPD domain-containing protein [Clostridia bacterium]|nr:TIGR03905 family TSCPD domain-containing protein [Clostridia bacterium]